MDRRIFLGSLTSAAALRILPVSARSVETGRLKQGIAKSLIGSLPFEQGCKLAASLGIRGVDFADKPEEWALVRRYGMTVSMLRADYHNDDDYRHYRPPGWHQIGLKVAQGEYLTAIHGAIDAAASHGFPNVFASAGDRTQVTYSEGADNAVEFLNKAKAHAEARNVTICIEILNSMGIQAPKMSLFDHMSWGVNVMQRVNSPRVKILYDVFHAQLMEGNIVQTLRDDFQYIGHVHTGAVPGRHELFRADELNYRFIAQALAELKYSGFVSHEWTASPGSNLGEDLRRSIELMRV
jgi:hydroxypyruvate isomerase